MKKVTIGLGVGIAVMFSGCVSLAHVGKGTYRADSTFGHTYSVMDKKKVNIFLKQFKKETISKPIGKSLNYKDVLVFNTSVPSDCKKLGYIVVSKDEGFTNKTGFKFGQTQPPKDEVLELIKKKAAKYGIKAVSNKTYASMTNIKTEQYVVETKNPYESISYIKMGGDTLDGYRMIYKKDPKLDTRCKKTKNYFQCVRKKVIQQAPEKNIRFLHAVTALQCSTTTLKESGSGQTTMSIDMENKFKSFFK